MYSYFPNYLPLLVFVIILVARRPAHTLRKRGAITPETAQALDDLKPRDRGRLDRLMAQGVVREVTPGRYYYDMSTERARMKQRVPWLIAVAVALGVLAIALSYFARHRVTPLP